MYPSQRPGCFICAFSDLDMVSYLSHLFPNAIATHVSNITSCQTRAPCMRASMVAARQIACRIQGDMGVLAGIKPLLQSHVHTYYLVRQNLHHHDLCRRLLVKSCHVFIRGHAFPFALHALVTHGVVSNLLVHLPMVSDNRVEWKECLSARAGAVQRYH